MKRTTALWHAILLGSWLASAAAPAASAEEPKPPANGTKKAVVVEKDLVYGTGGGQELHLDLFRPTDQNGTLPGLIVIHGGAWRAGSKDHMRIFCEQFARAGYVVTSVQYRFCPEHRFPAQIEDVKCAVRWMRANAAKYGLDPARIGAMGASAGGHLSLLLGLMDPKDGHEGNGGNPEQSSKVQAVVNYFGPTKFTLSDWEPKDEHLLVDFFGGGPTEVPAQYESGSPTTYVDENDPPILSVHGTRDPLVPYAQAVVLHSALRDKGVVSELELVPAAGHGWWGSDLQNTQRVSLEFLARHLGQKR